MKKRLLSLLLVVVMLTSIVVPAYAAELATLTYALDVNGESSVVVQTNDIITVNYSITPSKSASFIMNQNQIVYDPEFLELQSCAASNSSYKAEAHTETDGTRYVFFNTGTSKTTSKKIEVGTITFKVIGTKGSTTVVNTEYKAENSKNELFGKAKQDLTITIGGTEPTTAFTVSFNANGGSVTPASATGSSTSPVTLPTPERAGFIFNGWKPAIGDVISTAITSYTPTSDTTLTAQWKAAAPTGLAGVMPTTPGGSDGKITGVTTAMQYKLKTAESYTPCNGTEVTNLAAGTYLVQVKGGSDYTASDPVEVTVPANVPPVETGVCRIGSVSYDTLAEAIDAAETNNVIVLIQDVIEGEHDFNNKEITLDLGGYTLGGTAKNAENVTVCNTPAGEASIKDKVYPTLAEAVADAKTGDTIVILKDITSSANCDLASKAISINENGYTVNSNFTNKTNAEIGDKSYHSNEMTLAATGVYKNDVSAFAADGFDAKKTNVEGDTIYISDVAGTFKAVAAVSTETDRDTENSEVDVYSGDVIKADIKITGARFVGVKIAMEYDTEVFEDVTEDYGDYPDGWEPADDGQWIYKGTKADGGYWPDGYVLGTFYFKVADTDEVLTDYIYVSKAEVSVAGSWKSGQSVDDALKLTNEEKLDGKVNILVPTANVPVTGVSVDETAALKVGETKTLTATVTPANATNKQLSWKSSNESIATVDASGKVTAIAEGTATITVTTADGSYTDTCAVTVSKRTPVVTGTPTASVAYGATVAATDIVETGVTVMDGETPVEGSWSWKNVTSYGDATGDAPKELTATFTPSDEDTYNNVDVTVNVTVAKADPSYTAPTGLTATYGQTLADVDIANGDGTGDGTWSWADDTTSVGNVGTNGFKAKFTPSDTTNYNVVEDIDVNVTVGKADVDADVLAKLAAYNAAYDGSEHDAITGTTDDALSGYTLSYSTTSGTEGFGDTMPKVKTVSDSKDVWVKVSDANHESVVKLSAAVTKADNALTINAPQNVTYGDTGVAGSVASQTFGTADDVTYTFSSTENGTYAAWSASNAAGTWYVKGTIAGTDNYNAVTSTPVSFTVAAKAIDGSVTVSNTSPKYGDELSAVVTSVTPEAARSGLTYQWYRGNAAIEGATDSTYTVVSDDIGSTIKVKVSGSDNYSGDLTSEATAAAAKATQTITAENQTVLIGGELTIVASTNAADDGATLTYAINGSAPAGVSISGNKLTVADTASEGTVTIDIDSAATDNYAAAEQKQITVTISNKADAGVSFTAPESKTYGDADFTIKATVTTAGTNGTWTWTSSDPTILEIVKGDTDTVKVKVLKADATGATLTAKYESDTTVSTFTSGSIPVNKKELTVTGVTATARDYAADNTTVALVSTSAALQGVVTGDDVELVSTSAAGAVANADAGQNKAVTVTGFALSGDDAANYTLTQPTGIKVTINKATPTYEAPTGLTATYGQTLANVELSNGWSWMNSNTSVGDASDTAKNFKAKFTPADQANYKVVENVDVGVTVGKKTLTITGVTATDRAYEAGNTTVALTGGTLVGVVSGDTVSFTLGEGTMDNANVGGDKAVTTSITLTGEDAANYTLTPPTVTVNITKAAQTAPDVDGTAPEGVEANNGKLTGLTDAMEYSSDGGTTWVTCPNGELTGLGNGTYLVRYAGDDNHEASEAVTIVLKYEAAIVPVTREGVEEQKVDVKISGTNAELLFTTDDRVKLGTVVNENVDADVVTIDLTGVEASAENETGVIQTVDIPKEALDNIAEMAAAPGNNVTKLEIKMADGTAKFDAKALAEIKTQAGTNGVKLVVVYNEYDAEQDEYKEALTAEQKTTLESRREDNTDAQQTVYEIHLEKLDGTPICTEDLNGFGEGKASVTVKHLLPAGATNVKVFYLRPDGTTDDIPFTREGDYVVFEADHFSDYVISYKESGHTPGPGPSVDYNTVRIGTMTNGKVTATPTVAPKGRTITLTVTPNDGYQLVSLTVTDGSNKTVKVTDLGNGKYSFVMPDSDVRVNATFTKKSVVSDCPRDYTCPIEPFTDTVNDAWWHDGIHYCVERGLMQGYPGNLFGPNDHLSRAQIVTILWRMEGSPVVNYAMSFKDVKAGQWYTEAIRWAQSTGVVLGYSSEAFGPNDDITREQLAAILYRYANYKGIDVSARSDLAQFNDAGKISGWALDNVKWAVEVGMINGTSTTTIAPTDYTNRAQAAAMIQRFCENILGK